MKRHLFLKGKSLSVILFLLGFLSRVDCFAIPSDLLVQKCNEMNGELVNKWTCPASGRRRSGDMCHALDENNVSMYFDGCSGSFDNYGDVFFNACVTHDLCYHHEPASNGLTKIECDNQFYYNMENICKMTRAGDQPCLKAAQAFYSAVAIFGGTSWMCSKEKANYPRENVFEILLGLN